MTDFRLCSDSLDHDEEKTVRELTRKYIRCSSRLTIAHVKKYLKMKLSLSDADQVCTVTIQFRFLFFEMTTTFTKLPGIVEQNG